MNDNLTDTKTQLKRYTFYAFEGKVWCGVTGVTAYNYEEAKKECQKLWNYKD